MGNYFLSLSLFVILLCFFIVLGANSSFEQTKAGAVMSSLSKAFTASNQDIQKFSPMPSAIDTHDAREGSALGRVQGAFTAQLPAADIAQNRFGTSLRVRMDLKTFEAAVSEAALSGQTDQTQPSLRPVLLALLDAQDTPGALRMDMILETPGNPGRLAAEKSDVMGALQQRAMATARNLENAGMPARLLSVGLGQGEDGYIVLYFRPRQETTAGGGA